MSRRPRVATEAGFSLVELLVVVGLIGTLAGMAVLVTPATLQSLRADGGLAQIENFLQRAKDRSIADRRDISIAFVGTNTIQMFREPVVINEARALLDTITLENNMEFRLVPGLPDTPDNFGNAAATDFGGAAALLFRPEGLFTDGNPNLDPLNGTIFIANGFDPLTARALTVFGPTALFRGYRWDGSRWAD